MRADLAPFSATMDHPVLRSWLASSSTPINAALQSRDQPRYWTSDPSSLATTSSIHALHFGTGDRIFESILPAIEATEHELILVTCYWARASSHERLNDSLRKLSAKAVSQNRKIRVRLCFSSSGLWQKLFHTASLSGRVYDPSKWTNVVGLPHQSELQGLDLELKSIFILPISIIHPKFIIVDRAKVFSPSCNISWEDWFEGCLELTGPVVQQYITFWLSFWASDADKKLESDPSTPSGNLPSSANSPSPRLLSTKSLNYKSIQTIFLPSPHHRNPQLRLPWQISPPAPPTPLNLFLLAAFDQAKQAIYIQTPNLTSQPCIVALLSALQRGVNVRLLTSERLQLLEQIITAGTTSPRCVKRLVATYQKLLQNPSDTPLGRLEVLFYQPKPKGESGEPDQSHLKLTVIDDDIAVFGSGNMDRASWFTSQELGIAFFSAEFVEQTRAALGEALEGRTKVFYDSKEER